MAKQLWILGTSDSPVIQGQDGLPFYHQPGGWIRYSDGQVVNNDCLCHCRTYLYYVDYIHLAPENKKVFVGFSNSGPEKYRLTSDSKQGYVFKQIDLHCIPQYKPAGTYQCGVSLIPDLPYSLSNSYNRTTSCPDYYREEAPFKYATTIKRYINTYVSNDCGVPVGSDSSSSGALSESGPFCWGTFEVYDLPENPGGMPLQQGDCSPSQHPRQQVEYIDQTTAIVTVYNKYTPDEEDPQESCYMCQAQLLEKAIITAQQHAPTPQPVVYWSLYYLDIEPCSPPPYDNWTRVYQWQEPPADIWGNGDGYGPQSWHSTALLYRNPWGYYQWVATQSQQTVHIPASIVQAPTLVFCSSNVFPHDSDSQSEQSSSESVICPQNGPCNVRKQFPYFYQRYSTHFPRFNIWRKYASHPSDSWSLVERNLYDWQVLPKWDGNWVQYTKNSSNRKVYVDTIVDILDGKPTVHVQFESQSLSPSESGSESASEQGNKYWEVSVLDCDTGNCITGAPTIFAQSDSEFKEKLKHQTYVCDRWPASITDNDIESGAMSYITYLFKAPKSITQMCISYTLGSDPIKITGYGEGLKKFKKNIRFPVTQDFDKIAAANSFRKGYWKSGTYTYVFTQETWTQISLRDAQGNIIEIYDPYVSLYTQTATGTLIGNQYVSINGQWTFVDSTSWRDQGTIENQGISGYSNLTLIRKAAATKCQDPLSQLFYGKVDECPPCYIYNRSYPLCCEASDSTCNARIIIPLRVPGSDSSDISVDFPFQYTSQSSDSYDQPAPQDLYEHHEERVVITYTGSFSGIWTISPRSPYLYWPCST